MRPGVRCGDRVGSCRAEAPAEFGIDVLAPVGVVEQRQSHHRAQGLRSGQRLLHVGMPDPGFDPPAPDRFVASGLQRASAELRDDGSFSVLGELLRQRHGTRVIDIPGDRILVLCQLDN